MSTLERYSARQLPPTSATTATITVIGCRSAKTIGFITILVTDGRAIGEPSPLGGTRGARFQRAQVFGHVENVPHGSFAEFPFRQRTRRISHRAVQAELGAVEVGHRRVVVIVRSTQGLDGGHDLLRTDEKDQRVADLVWLFEPLEVL